MGGCSAFDIRLCTGTHIGEVTATREPERRLRPAAHIFQLETVLKGGANAKPE